MYGPGLPPPPPARRVARRVARVVLRTALACIPLVTLGMLAWVPLVRLATLRRRVADWLLCGAIAVLSSTGLMLAGGTDQDTPLSDAGVVVLVVLAMVCPVYYLAAEIRWYQRLAAPPPWTPPYPARYVVPSRAPVTAPGPTASPPVPSPPAAPTAGDGRIDRVRAELDELSAYLRAQEER